MNCELIETLIFPFKFNKLNNNEKLSLYYKKSKLQYKGYFSLDVIFNAMTIQKNLN